MTLSLLFALAGATAQLTEEGKVLKDTQTRLGDFVCGNPLRVLIEPLRARTTQIIGNEYTKAYQDTMNALLSALESSFHGAMPPRVDEAIEIWRMFVACCDTVPPGTLMYHKNLNIFTDGNNGGIDEKWSTYRGFWTFPMIDVNTNFVEGGRYGDFSLPFWGQNDEEMKSRLLIPDAFVMVRSSTPGMLNLDTYPIAKDFENSFDSFLADLQALCRLFSIQKSDLQAEPIVSDDICLGPIQVALAEIGSVDNDRHVVRLLSKGFRGWIMKETPPFEPQIMLFRTARKNCIIWSPEFETIYKFVHKESMLVARLVEIYFDMLLDRWLPRSIATDEGVLENVPEPVIRQLHAFIAGIILPDFKDRFKNRSNSGRIELLDSMFRKRDVVDFEQYKKAADLV